MAIDDHVKEVKFFHTFIDKSSYGKRMALRPNWHIKENHFGFGDILIHWTLIVQTFSCSSFLLKMWISLILLLK